MLFYRNCLKNSEEIFFVNKDKQKNFFILKRTFQAKKIWRLKFRSTKIKK